MKPIRIDFAPSSVRRSVCLTPAAGWLLGAAGLALCASAAVAIAHTMAWQTAREAQLRQAYAGSAVVAAPAKKIQIPEAQAGAVNAAVLQLNLPWRDLQEAVEAATPPTVALLALDPDPKTRTLRILAEAKNSDDMLAFVEQIKKQAFFLGADLAKHETNDQDPNHPLRFQIDAQWAAHGTTP